MHEAAASLPAEAPRRRIAWLGDATATELALARAWAAEQATLIDGGPDAADAAAGGPALALLASDRPGRWTLQEAVAISRRWPLTPLVAVVGSLADGRRRSGPVLPGVEEVGWSELPGRLAWWLAELAAGRAGTLGMPATARREERLLESAVRLRDATRCLAEPATVSIAAPRPLDIEPLADLVSALGHPVLRRTSGRPPLDEPAEVLVWDPGPLGAAELAWLRMLAANRPELRIVILDSFPRGDTTLAALRAGAVAVLARPLGLESLAGTLLRLKRPPLIGLGPAGTGG